MSIYERVIYFQQFIRFQKSLYSRNLCFCAKAVIRSVEKVRLQINIVSAARKYRFFQEIQQVYQFLDFKYYSSVLHSTSFLHIFQLCVNKLHILSRFYVIKIFKLYSPLPLIRANTASFCSCYL